MKISRALLSVFDKKSLVPFAHGLQEIGIEILSTNGTAKTLLAAGISVVQIEKITGFQEILGGRIKTLHPKIHAGLLYLREDEQHVQEIRAYGVHPIDLVVVNLYPFSATASLRAVTLEAVLQQIDIGGPAMIRSAAKNYRNVAVVTDPADYTNVLEELRKNAGEISYQLRKNLAIKAFTTTSSYDASIVKYLEKEQATSSECEFTLRLPLACHLRYGENPHQNARLYGSFFDFFEKLHGRELSYNNVLDISSAAALIAEFAEPTVAILKHMNPCGVASNPDLKNAWINAFATDKQATFGGVIVTNRLISLPLAKAITEIFSEVIVAPDFTVEARTFLQKKKSRRLIRILRWPMDARDIHSVPGGLLIQEADRAHRFEVKHKVVSSRLPDRSEREAMAFGWKVVKHVKSNAIVYAAKDRTLGIGAGQMSRIDATRIAVWKAREAGLSLQGSAVCSDAFFPFADGLIAAAEAGATTVIQPGGAILDGEVIAAADSRGMSMIFTGIRHFKHY